MRYFEQNSDTYNDQIEKIERQDHVEADFVNSFIQRLINNDAYVKEKLLQHVNDKETSHGISESLDTYYAQLTAYTDKAINDLINGAPTTLDTLKELADAINDNKSVQEALDAAIGTKANANEFDSHTKTVATKTVSGHVKVDDELSNTSDNPVQNKVMSAAIDTKLDKTGDIQYNTVTFQNDDNVDVIVEESLSGGVTSTEYILTDDKTWHEMEPIKTKEKLGSVFGKISTLFHNVRYLYKMLGTTDISQIDSGSNGTITSIISRPDVKLKYGSFLIKVPGQSTIDYEIMDDAEIERQTPSGYKFVCCLIDRGGYADQWMVNISRFGGGLRALIQSRYADELSTAVFFFMLFVKESIFPET